MAQDQHTAVVTYNDGCVEKWSIDAHPSQALFLCQQARDVGWLVLYDAFNKRAVCIAAERIKNFTITKLPVE